MSIAGVRSSQGDSFQSLVAIRYAVEMLYKSELEEIEVDSTSLDTSGSPIVVDDIVAHYRDLDLYIQVKKNQKDFNSWSTGDLGDELRKAWIQWRRDPSAKILFISRNNFGAVAKLKDHSATQPSSEALDKSLTPKLRAVAARISGFDEQGGDHSDLHAFLQRLNFETVSPDRMQLELIGLLSLHVAHGSKAFDLIKKRIEEISRREIGQSGLAFSPHRLTRQDLFALLSGEGIEICSPRAVQDAIRTLSQLSRIGRSWQRQIGKTQLTRAVVGEVVDRIGHKPGCLLLSAGPGVGKTCVLLSVLERLEQKAVVLPVFIQSRDFSGAQTAEERDAMGLPSSLVGDVARLSESRHVVVIIDSIDVLSIARDHHSMAFVLSLIDRLRLIPNVTIVAACRSFDLKYDGRLASRDWNEIIEIDLLDWASEVEPLLATTAVDLEKITAEMRDLLCNPRLLAIFYDVMITGEVPTARSAQELTEIYLQRVVRESEALGDPAMSAIMSAARWMLDNRRLDIPVANSQISESMVRQLLSAGVMVETHQRGLSFAHQTLLDVLAVAHAKAEGETLAAFIRTRAAAPFIRPTIRAFLFSLRSDDVTGFRRQTREVLGADDIAFHLRRLVAESLAEVSPTVDDWPIVRHLLAKHSPLFNAFFGKAIGDDWIRFFHSNWLSVLIQNQDGPWLLRLLERTASSSVFSDELVGLWKQALDWDWIDQQQLLWVSSRLLDRFDNWMSPDLRDVFKRLIANAKGDHDGIGKPLSEWILATDSNDDLLWHYIARGVTVEDSDYFHFGNKLKCAPHIFNNNNFLQKRLQTSESLLDMAVDSIEAWSNSLRREYEDDNIWVDGFLQKTRYGRVHSAHDTHHVDGLTILMSALENTCIYHAENETRWWEKNAARLRSSREGSLRYCAILAMTANPEGYVQEAAATLLDKHLMKSHRLRWEVGSLMNAAFPYLTPAQQEKIQSLVTEADDEDRGEDGRTCTWRIGAQRELLAHVPACYRTADAQGVIDQAEVQHGPFRRSPSIDSWGGLVRAPVSRNTMLELSDKGLMHLIDHYPSKSPNARDWDRSGSEDLVGGADQVAMEVRETASRQPIRFMKFYDASGAGLGGDCRESILGGIANHLRYRFGNLQSSENWSPTESPDGQSVAGWLINELESRYDFWVGCRGMGDILMAASDVVDSDNDCDRLAFLLIGGLRSDDPTPDREDSNDHITVAINSARGKAVEAAFSLASRWSELERPLPLLLIEVLKRCASDPHSSVRSLVLWLLPTVLYHHEELGWKLYERALFSHDDHPWRHSQRCLYYNYYKSSHIVRKYLPVYHDSNNPDAVEVWSQISALSCLAGHIAFEEFLKSLRALNMNSAWSGAASVFAANIDAKKLQETCERGLITSIIEAEDNGPVLGRMSRIFHESKGHSVGLEFVRTYFSALAKKEPEHGRSVLGLGEWLASVSVSDPEYALAATEIILEYGAGMDSWDGSPYTKLLTALFREAEERELSDNGGFLARVVIVQDALLDLGIHSLETWLQDAERP